MKIITIGGQDKRSLIRKFLHRVAGPDPELEATVAEILQSVREKGDEALRTYTETFDGVVMEDFKVSEDEIQAAVATVGKKFLAVLQEAYEHIFTFHQRQLESTWFEEMRPGVKLGQKFSPIERVGLYVPGGTAGYPSTVLMTAAPAMVAGVGSITMVSPPDEEGQINPYILAAAHVVGVKDIYKVGGAQAIAALASGTESIPAVHKIVGPGNSYVAMAKRQVFGTVGIDMIAGPTEIGILADGRADATFVAADLLSQAEHDVKAACILVTDDTSFAEKVSKQVDELKATLKRNVIVEQAIENYGIIFVAEDKDECVAMMNLIAPEHLEILWDEPEQYIDRIKHAGAIFLGPYTPEPVGDYFAGPNHTLPTGGTARFSSPLGVYDYMKRSSLLSYDFTALSRDADKIMAFARKEGLTAHAAAIAVRIEKEKP